MKALTVKLKDKDFKLSINDDGLLLPCSTDILNHVGLEMLTKGKRLERFYNLCQVYKHKQAIRYICYLENISFKKARIRIKHYSLIDLGLRITWGQIENQRHNDMLYYKSELTNLLDLDNVPTTELMIDLLNKEGFNVHLIDQMSMF